MGRKRDAVTYSSKDGRVTLEMSREDYSLLRFLLGGAAGAAMKNGEKIDSILELLNRLNFGNPEYTPYQTDSREKG